jgi:hypothetical protein
MSLSELIPFSDDEALPTIPITLSCSDFFVSANALLDTGSTVNLLPYDIGRQLNCNDRSNSLSRLNSKLAIVSC